MSGFMPQTDPLPVLRGEENIEQWKLKVIQAYAGVGLADYLFASANDTVTMPTPEKLALGISILEPSLVQQRAYLTKTGWNFDACRQDPKALYQLVLRSITQRALSVTINDDLFQLLRIEMKDQESVDDYTHRVRGLRGCLQNAGYHVDEQLLVRVTLHGMMGDPGKKGWVSRTVRDDLAPGSLTFNKLEKLMLAAEKSQKTATAKQVDPPKTVTQPSASQRVATASSSVQGRDAGASSTGPHPRHVHFDNISPDHGRPAIVRPNSGSPNDFHVRPDNIRPGFMRPNITRSANTGSSGVHAQFPLLSNAGPENVRSDNRQPSGYQDAQARHQGPFPWGAAAELSDPVPTRIKDAMSMNNVLNPENPALRPMGQPLPAPPARTASQPAPAFSGQARRGPSGANASRPPPSQGAAALRGQNVYTPPWLKIPGAYTEPDDDDFMSRLAGAMKPFDRGDWVPGRR